jgi:hypothetical protein
MQRLDVCIHMKYHRFAFEQGLCQLTDKLFPLNFAFQSFVLPTFVNKLTECKTINLEQCCESQLLTRINNTKNLLPLQLE